MCKILNIRVDLRSDNDMYDENILSQMRYGSIAWGSAKASKKINKIQQKALATMTCTKKSHLPALEGELGVLNIENIKDMELAKFYLKLQNMSEDRIPKRIFNRKWQRNKLKSSTRNHIRSILRKWRINLEIKDLIQMRSAETGKDPNEIHFSEIKSLWKSILEKHIHEYTKRRTRKDRTKDNFFYKNIIPTVSKIKPYLAMKGTPTDMKLKIATAEFKRQKCPLCKAEDIILEHHVVTSCGATFKSRKHLLEKIGKNTRKFGPKAQHDFLMQIYDAEPNNELINEYLEIAAVSLNSAQNQITLAQESPEDLQGHIMDIRQNGEWFRTKIIHHDRYKSNDILVDSNNIDTWPEIWAGSSFTLDLNQLKPLKAVILRDHNALFFDKIDQNSGKIIYIKTHPIKLLRHLRNGIYETKSGKINLSDLIKCGQLNDCPINGIVARRYNSALKGASPMPNGKE